MHYYNTLNPYKICKLSIGGLGLQEKDNWRSFIAIKTEKPLLRVSNSVLLFTQSKEWDMSYTNSYESAWSYLDQKGGLGKISQIGETLRSFAMMTGSFGDMTSSLSGGRFLPQYSKAPAWSGTGPLSLSNSITFDFRFGMANIFSGFSEVVIPIISLILPWAPYNAKDSFSNLNFADHSNYFRGPLPTGPTYLWQFFQKFGSNVKDDFKKSMEQHREASESIQRQNKKEADADKDFNQDGEKERQDANFIGKAVNTLTTLENSLKAGVNRTIEQVLHGDIDSYKGENRFVHLTIGRFSLPPMIVKDVSWKFDMSHTDSAGYPTSGSVTLGGLEAIEIANIDGILDIFNQGPVKTGEFFVETKESLIDTDKIEIKGGDGNKYRGGGGSPWGSTHSAS